MSLWKMLLGVVVVGAAGVVALGYLAFGAFLPWREEAEAQRLAELIGATTGTNIAEVGAGRGRFAAALARRVAPGGTVWATEISEARLLDLRARAQALPNLVVVGASTSETGLPDQCCDVVLMRAMYHHVGDVSTFLRAVSKALRPGGRVVVIDFAPNTLWFHSGRPDGASDQRQGHGVSQADVAAEFRAAGFVVMQEVSSWSRPLWLTMFSKQ